MHVLHFGPLPPPYGGVEVFLDLLLRSQQSLKLYNVDSLNTSRGENYRHYKAAQFNLNGLSRRISLAWRLVQKLREFSPDVVHYQVGRADWSFLSDALNFGIIRASGAKLVVHLHNAPEQSLVQDQSVFPGKSRITQILWRTIMKKVHCLIVLSHQYRQAFSCFMPASKIVVVPDTCTDDLLEINRSLKNQACSRDNIVIVFLGRLTREKGVFDLLQAAFLLHRRGQTFRLRLCGKALTKEAEVELRRLVEQLSLSDCVAFEGVVDRERKRMILTDADVVVLPSYSESFGMALLEGMAAGLPVIGTRVGCVDEIITEGETGFIFMPGDVSALEEALIYLAKQPQVRQQMGAAGRAKFRRSYSRERVVEIIDSVYVQLYQL